MAFSWPKARLSLETTYLHSGFVRDDLIAIDLDVRFFNLNVSFSVVASLHKYEHDVNIWIARRYALLIVAYVLNRAPMKSVTTNLYKL